MSARARPPHPTPAPGFYLEVPPLGFDPFLDEILRVVAEAQHEIALRLQLVDGFDGLVNLGR